MGAARGALRVLRPTADLARESAEDEPVGGLEGVPVEQACHAGAKSCLTPSISARVTGVGTEVTNRSQDDDSRGVSTPTGMMSGGRLPATSARMRIMPS